MEPATPEAASINQEVPQTPETKKDGHWITIASMALFVLLSLGAVAFLYYQNQQLKSMLAGYQNVPSPTPSATADPTASWKTYTNTKQTFSFKTSSLEAITMDYKTFATKAKSAQGTILVLETAHYTTKMAECTSLPATKDCFVDSSAWGQSEKIRNITLGGISATSYYINDATIGEPIHIVETISSPYIQIATVVGGPGLDEIFDQILSTFKFIEASPTPSAKACTQEAKLCPDGTSVGRTGPNCEFAPCPTP